MEIPAYNEPQINRIELLEEKKGWYRNKKFVLGLGIGLILLIVIPGVILLSGRDKSEKEILVGLDQQTPSTESKQYPVTYYVTTSQQFLARAQGLSAQEEQTQTDKEKIIAEIKKALQIIDEGVRSYPQDDRIYAQRASIYQALVPTLDEARKYALIDLKTASNLNPQNPEYHQKMGELYQSLGNLDNSASCFYNAYNLEPNNQQILYYLANSLEQSGQLEKAVYYFGKLITLLPDTDENKVKLVDRKARIKKMVLTVKAETLSDPSLTIPDKPESEEFILGSQDLPLEQAFANSSLIIAQGEDALSSTSSETDQNAKSGQALLPADQKEIKIFSQQINLNSKILVQTNEGEKITLSVRAKKAAEENETGWFRVEADKVPEKDLEFTWWIVD